MTHILHIDASPRGESASHWLRQRSISRTLSHEFISEWKAAHPNDTVTYRDLGHYPVPFVTEEWIAAAFSRDYLSERLCLRQALPTPTTYTRASNGDSAFQ